MVASDLQRLQVNDRVLLQILDLLDLRLICPTQWLAQLYR